MKFYSIIPRPYLKLRIIATLIDYGIFLGLCWAYIYSFGEPNENDSYELHGTAALLVPFCWFLYFVVLENVNRATPGHDICKLRVVNPDGYRVTLLQSFKRRICDPIDLGFYGIPAVICVLKTTKHQRLGDLLAGTLVVKQSDISETDLKF